MSDTSAPTPEPEQPQGEQAPSTSPTQPIPPVVGAEQPFGPPPVALPAAAAAVTPPRRGLRGLWREATSTTGGRIAAIVAATLGTLVIIGAIGFGAAAIGHAVNDRGAASVQGTKQGLQGQRRLQRRGQGQGQQGQGQQGQGQGNGRGGLGMGGGRLGGVLPGMGNGLLGEVLHGEFVTGANGSGTSMLYQVGQVTAYTKGSSLAVKSSDGFTATYSINASSKLVGSNGSPLVVGDQVRVLATKDGSTVTFVQLVGSASGGSSGSSSGPGA